MKVKNIFSYFLCLKSITKLCTKKQQLNFVKCVLCGSPTTFSLLLLHKLTNYHCIIHSLLILSFACGKNNKCKYIFQLYLLTPKSWQIPKKKLYAPLYQNVWDWHVLNFWDTMTIYCSFWIQFNTSLQYCFEGSKRQ